MKVIFLDFDGVVSIGFSKKFEKMSLFCSFLRRNKDINVVISSSWREFRTLDELKLFFDEDVRDQILDKTPTTVWDDESSNIPQSRSNEIMMWIEAHPGISRYIALDDCPEFFSPLFKNLYAVNMSTGLTENDIKNIERIINETNNRRK